MEGVGVVSGPSRGWLRPSDFPKLPFGFMHFALDGEGLAALAADASVGSIGGKAGSTGADGRNPLRYSSSSDRSWCAAETPLPVI